MDLIVGFWGALKFGAFNMAWVFIVLWGIERLWPKDRPSERVQLASLRFWLFYAVAGAFIVSAYTLAAAPLNLRPLVLIDLKGAVPAWAAYALGPFASLIVYDFFNYWMHRAQHRWFWAQHSIHHSIRELSAVNSFMHWTEELFRIAAISVPTAVLFNLDIGGVTLASTMLLVGHGNFIHAASSLHFGPVGRWLLTDNRWHRIHHSIEPRHYDRNFATAFPLWDRLFGTAHVPARDEWPAVGVHDAPEPATVDDYLWRPFRRQNQAGAVVLK